MKRSGGAVVRSLRRWGGRGSVVVIALVPSVAVGQTLSEAKEQVRVGQYDDAIRSYKRLTRGDDVILAGRGLVRALVNVGRYEDAATEARQLDQDHSPQLSNVLGEVWYHRGRIDEAERLFQAAIRGASDSVVARLNLAILQYERGERELAFDGFDYFIRLYNSRAGLSAEELTAVANAGRYLGVRNYQLFQDALRVFDEATAADPSNLEPKVRVGELFLEKYQSGEATSTFEEILAINASNPRALLGLARTQHFDGSSDATETVRKSLEVNPNLISARVLLARLYLEIEQYDRALVEVERALEVDSSAPEALATLATIRFLQGDDEGFDDARRRALARNPAYADLYNTLAELTARNRLYSEALAFAEQAVALDSQSWRGYGLIGMNQLRTGAVEVGRANLEVSFAGDPFNPWTKNTLDLLDTFSNYTTVRSKHFDLVLHQDEFRLLQIYLGEVADEAYETLAQRYHHRPETPIRLEVYPRHADFSVRTVGLAGLGALGVSFGNVLAMDSPSARQIGDFHWGATLWHEVAHTFHLAMSNHRVPRWFTEGLAVFEERRAHQGWGDDASVGFLLAYMEGRMQPVSELNNGFVRPRYPQEVVFSYYLASLVCELIQRDWGDRALVDMLRAYGDGKSTNEVFAAVLDMQPREFDVAFDRYMRERFTGPLTALRSPHISDLQQGMELPALLRLAAKSEQDFPVQLEAGRALVRAERFGEAVPYLQRAKSLFADYAGADSPYWYLSVAYSAQGALEQAAEELAALTSINAGHYLAFLRLAETLGELKDERGASEALDRALFVYPFDMDHHTRLAELYGGLADWQGAIRERRAVVALDPVDRAEAHYQLALAYFEAGELQQARSVVLRALERAPNFEKALDLLLDIRSRGSGEDWDGR